MTRQAPTLDARRSPDGTHLMVWCLYCNREHSHGRHSDTYDCPHAWDRRDTCTCPTGTGDGHRAAHCGDPASPYANTGYIVREIRP